MAVRPLDKSQGPKLMVNLVDEKAKWLGNHTFMRYPAEDWQSQGYRTITWRQYADAVDKVSWWLDQQLGHAEGADTIAYFGPADPRYAIILPAVMKTGRKILVPDQRLTKVGLEKLLEATACAIWIRPEGFDAMIPDVSVNNINVIDMPSLEWCLNEQGLKYPYNKTFDDAKYEEAVIIHTSGTTGDPKPIRFSNGFITSLSSIWALSKKNWPQGIIPDAYNGKAMFTTCLPQWAGGMAAYAFFPIFSDTICIIPPPDTTDLSSKLFAQILERNIIDGVFCPPHTIHQLWRDNDGREQLKSLDYVMFAGAPLDRAVGDELCLHTKLLPLIGATETGLQHSLSPLDRKLWYTHCFLPEHGLHLLRVPDSSPTGNSRDDLYELVIERKPGEEPHLFQTAWWNLAHKDMHSIEIKELYRPVPDLNGQTRWEFVARKDDLTKLNWLAKFHAHDIEIRLKKHPNVSEVFVGGEGRPAPFVIIEPRGDIPDEKGAEELLAEIYRTSVARENASELISEISIPKETVMLAKREKPFKKTAKGTLSRKAIELDYSNEIEAAYKQFAIVTAGSGASASK